MSDLLAGAELDALVAGVLGDTYERRAVPCPDSRPGCCVLHTELVGVPAYSTDWSAAMAAAERVGLFDSQMQSLTNMGGVWSVYDWDSAPAGALSTAEAPTGPLAICRAILKLHGT